MTEQNAITKSGRGRPRKYEFPAQLTCTVTGKVVKTNPTQFARQLEASGKDMATFIKTYISRAGRKQVKVEVKVKKAGADLTAVPAPVEPVADNSEGV